MATVLIESAARDVTALEVIRWLKRWGHTTVWIHDADPVIDLTLHLDSHHEQATLHFQSGLCITLSDVDAVWHRRSALTTRVPAGSPPALLRLLEADWAGLRSTLYRFLHRARHLGSLRQETQTFQLEQLLQARALGIRIPPTLVATSKAALRAFLQQYPQAITKRIDALPQLTLAGTTWAAGGTRAITLEEIESLDDHFFPALVQAQVEKAYELRIFFLRNNVLENKALQHNPSNDTRPEFFAQALLLARGRAPLVDVRTPPTPDHLRRVPFELPFEWATSLRALMDALKLDTGSIDAIVTPDDALVFLEVNPVGQLDGLSKECNYHLEKHIARYLAGEGGSDA